MSRCLRQHGSLPVDESAGKAPLVIAVVVGLAVLGTLVLLAAQPPDFHR